MIKRELKRHDELVRNGTLEPVQFLEAALTAFVYVTSPRAHSSARTPASLLWRIVSTITAPARYLYHLILYLSWLA